MKRVLLAGALLGLSTAAVSPTPAAPATSARAAIQAVYDQRNAALARKDAVGASAGFAPDFVGISRQGEKVGLAEHQAGMAQMLALVRQMKRSTVIQKFAVRGRMATAQTETIMAAAMQDPRSGRMIKGATDTVALDSWVKSGSGWLQEQTQEVETRRLR